MFKIPEYSDNKDVDSIGCMSTRAARRAYLKLIPGSFENKLELPRIERHQGRKVLRFDECFGFKARAAEPLIASIKSKVLVYCAPRTGHAALAIAELCKLYGKTAVFFAPASKQCTLDQACVLNYGCQLRFVRIAAMPVLNSYAKKWAEENGATFLPFGLANTPLVTAGVVKLCKDLSEVYSKPEEIWCAVSTGTMIRGLNIGFPEADLSGIAVARNLHEGELPKRAIVKSAKVPFTTKAKLQPPFNTTACYDAKAWGPCVKLGSQDAWFINVGSDKMVEDAAEGIDVDDIDSYRDWGDMKDLEKGLR